LLFVLTVGIFNVLKTLFVAHVLNFLGRLDFATGLPLLGKRKEELGKRKARFGCREIFF
jgi:hypothetical protein